ncbi:DUF4262 domain-containing protein [Actinophytocola gossypii]|uniref:DUF4262 domain-containing protein n=1 Tax=Actinophytocola gossypii TaxID=2812003 RepID=A0ABT2JBU9_9PSEU|nr:DUF4262 domain-containing protein [Actinophytocola gossypii]MCT2585336.1 DUF4262 domain-containing protein [Actinophytocola gossypii]
MSADCRCRLCAGDSDGLAARDLNLVWHVEEHGWGVVAVAEEDEVPGWAYSVGMWHTMRAPEVCMFGLRGRDMHVWVNAAGQQVRSGQPLRQGEERHGIIDGFPVLVRPVHPSWHDELFWLAVDFHRGPVPAVQLVWPDRHGRFPWHPDAGERCRTHQPHLWLPREDHPPGVWTRLAELADSPFPDVAGDELVLGSTTVISGEAPVAGVVHTADGRWEFLDGRGRTESGMVHLRHLITGHPHIRDFADLPRGHAAWREPDGNWSRAPHDG